MDSTSWSLVLSDEAETTEVEELDELCLAGEDGGFF